MLEVQEQSYVSAPAPPELPERSLKVSPPPEPGITLLQMLQGFNLHAVRPHIEQPRSDREGRGWLRGAGQESGQRSCNEAALQDGSTSEKTCRPEVPQQVAGQSKPYSDLAWADLRLQHTLTRT